MKIKFRKRENNNLRQIVKLNETDDLNNQKVILAIIEDVPSNIIESGDALTEEILEKINWNDNETVIFSNRNDNVKPAALNGQTQFVALANGELWVVPANGIGVPFKLGENVSGNNIFQIAAIDSESGTNFSTYKITGEGNHEIKVQPGQKFTLKDTESNIAMQFLPVNNTLEFKIPSPLKSDTDVKKKGQITFKRDSKEVIKIDGEQTSLKDDTIEIQDSTSSSYLSFYKNKIIN